MRAVIVTSEITFVPQNYDQLIMKLADLPEVYGLMVIRNRHWENLLQGVGAIVSNAAPALGWQLVKNFVNPRNQSRRRHYQRRGKKFWMVDQINSPGVLELIKRENIDLIINARTRSIYKPALLQAPRLGCVNIHHGLLPEQRGLMCDLWSHAERLPCGFSLHEMNSRIDDGRVIRRVEVSRSDQGYLEYLGRSSLLEYVMLRDFLKEVRETGTWTAVESYPGLPFTYRKNPTLNDFYQFKRSGIIL